MEVYNSDDSNGSITYWQYIDGFRTNSFLDVQIKDGHILKIYNELYNISTYGESSIGAQVTDEEIQEMKEAALKDLDNYKSVSNIEGQKAIKVMDADGKRYVYVTTEYSIDVDTDMKSYGVYGKLFELN